MERGEQVVDLFEIYIFPFMFPAASNVLFSFLFYFSFFAFWLLIYIYLFGARNWTRAWTVLGMHSTPELHASPRFLLSDSLLSRQALLCLCAFLSLLGFMETANSGSMGCPFVPRNHQVANNEDIFKLP